MKIKKNSLWDELYQFGASSVYDETDICTYVRQIFKALVMITLIIVIAVLFIQVVTEPYIALVMHLIKGGVGDYGFWWNDIGAAGASAFFQCIGVLYGLFILGVRFAKKRWNKFVDRMAWDKAPKKERIYNPIVLWYKSFKEKTCFLIERVDPTEAKDEQSE